MKKIILLLISLISIVPSSALTNNIPGGNALLPMPSEQEMQEIQKFLDTLSPDELDELAKIGEEIIQTAEKEGRPLFGPAANAQPIQKAKPQPAKPITTAHTVKPQDPVKPKERTLSSKEKARIQGILSGLVDAIASIRQKATSDETLIQLLAPLNTTLNDLTYYLNVVNYSKHLVQLTNKEFAPLNNNLRKLYEQVDEIDSQLDVPELEMSKKQSSDDLKKQHQKIKKAARILDTFRSIMDSGIKQKHVLMDLERLVKKYEPEALKIKKEQEEKEKKASTQSTSLPVTNVARTYRATDGSATRATQNYARRPGAYGGSSGYTPPTRSGTSRNFAGSNAKPSNFGTGANEKTTPSGAKKDSNNASNKKKEATEPANPQKPTEVDKINALEEKIKMKMEVINHTTGIHQDKLNSFLDDYLPMADPVIDHISEDFTNVVETISFELYRIKKDVTNWVSKINQQATGRNEYNKHRKRLKTYMENSMREVYTFHKKVKSNAGLLAQTSPRVTRHKESINQLIKHVDDIKKDLTKAP